MRRRCSNHVGLNHVVIGKLKAPAKINGRMIAGPVKSARQNPQNQADGLTQSLNNWWMLRTYRLLRYGMMYIWVELPADRFPFFVMYIKAEFLKCIGLLLKLSNSIRCMLYKSCAALCKSLKWRHEVAEDEFRKTDGEWRDSTAAAVAVSNCRDIMNVQKMIERPNSVQRLTNTWKKYVGGWEVRKKPMTWRRWDCCKILKYERH